MTLKQFLDTHLLFPIWLRLSHWMGLTEILLSDFGEGDIKVIHLYDTEANLRKSMASYLAKESNRRRQPKAAPVSITPHSFGTIVSEQK